MSSVIRIAFLLSLSAGLYVPVATGNSPGNNSVAAVDAKCSAGFSSLKLDSLGNPVIGYTAFCNNSSTQLLKVAHCGSRTCSTENVISVLDHGSIHSDFPADTALAIAINGDPVISYFYGNLDSGSGDLRMAFCGDANCGLGNSIITADASGTTGIGTSLLLDVSGNPVVSYVSENSGLRMLHCSDAHCTSSASTTVASGGVLAVATSVALDAAGNPVIAYETSSPQQAVNVAHCSDPDCSGSVTLAILDNVGGLGWFTGPSLRLDPLGHPVIVYFAQDIGEQNAHLRIAHCGDANCSSGNIITSVDDDASAAYGHSLVLDGKGNPALAYSSGSTRLLTVVRCGDANCASGNTLAHGDPNPAGPAIALDAQNRPVVSYSASKTASTAAQLRVLHCATPTCQ